MKYIIFTTFILSIALLMSSALACYMADASNYYWYDYTYTGSCGDRPEDKYPCPSPETSGYLDFSGPGIDDACAVAPRGKYYNCFEVEECCQCTLINDVLWRYGETNKCPSLSSENGNTCKIRLSGACEYPTEGRWDASESKCLQCSGNIEDKICGDTARIYVQYGTGICTKTGNKKCESACGASPGCDEVVPNSVSCDIYGNQLTIRACDSNCNYSSDEYVCEPANCGVSQSCGGTTYYCVYDGEKWVWSTTKPPDFCCSDADCSGYDPNTHLKLVCDCPDITKCSLQQDNNYQCKPLRKCDINNQCAPGWCCDGDPSVTPRGSGNCVQGIYSENPKYLCDPPGWSNEKTVDEKQANNFLDLIFNFFQSLFIR